MEINIKNKDGFLTTKYEYDENDQPHGYWENYYPNGVVSRRGCYEHGKVIGEWTTYWENGNIMFIGSFNDKPIGKWTWHHPEGEINEKEFYL